jgi:hypothetical protein
MPAYFLDPDTGELTALADAPEMMSSVWTGDTLIGRPYSAENRWFAFVPAESWPASADLQFPEPLPFLAND